MQSGTAGAEMGGKSRKKMAKKNLRDPTLKKMEDCGELEHVPACSGPKKPRRKTWGLCLKKRGERHLKFGPRKD